MCSAPQCNDTPESRPHVEATITTRDAQGRAGVRHLEIATHLAPDDLAADLVKIVQDKSGSDYVREVDADR